jgi:hypothetical protein
MQGPSPRRPAPRAPLKPPVSPTARSRRSVWPFAAALMLLILGAGGAWWWLHLPARAVVPTVLQPAPAPPAPIATAAVEGASYDELLAGRSDDWRVARLALNPKILVVEFPTLAAQGQALNRLAALLEKHTAPRDRVLGDEALARFIQQLGDTPETFYFGHDYPSEAVARFFTMAVNEQVRLNPQELRLGNLLLFSKMLREDNDRLVPDGERQAIVTFTALQADDPATKARETVDALQREATLRHELSHGEFFTNPAYREHCWNFWRALSDAERQLFRAFLTRQDYDPYNEELMVNEAQAFLMHTPDARAFASPLIGMSSAQLDSLRSRFREGMPPSIFSTIGAR